MRDVDDIETSYSIEIENLDQEFLEGLKNKQFKTRSELESYYKEKLRLIIDKYEKEYTEFLEFKKDPKNKDQTVEIGEGVKKEEGDLSSPISGKVVSIKVKKGDSVKKGDVLMVIEAMKMEYLIRAPYDGKIKNMNFKVNDQIEIGQNTVEISKKED